MELQARFLKSRFAFVLTIVLTTVITALSPLPSEAAKQNRGGSRNRPDPNQVITIRNIKDKNGDPVEVGYHPATQKLLEQFTPDKMFAEGEQLRANLRQQCGHGGNAAVHFVKNFPAEMLSFNMAVGFSANDQAKEDPAYMRHYVENSFVDPMGYASFAGFMLGQRGAASFFSMLNLTHDPCKILKRDPMAPMEKLEAKSFQKYMGYVAGPIAMSAGLLISDFMHQAMADPNIKTCAALQIGKIHDKQKITEAKKACNDAYREWVLDGGEKVRALVPDMISMTLVTGMMSAPQVVGSLAKKHILEKPMGIAAKRIAVNLLDEGSLRFTWVLSSRVLLVDGFTAVMTLAKIVPAPAAKFIGAAVSTYIFLRLNDIIEAPIKMEWETVTQGSDIGTSLTDLNAELARLRANKWVFTPKQADPRCDPKNPDNVRAGARGDVTNIPDSCRNTPHSGVELIQQLGKQDKKWRDYIMSETSQAAGNWSNYVLRFSNTLVDGRNFYLDIMKRIWSIRTKPDGDDLKRLKPLWGVPLSDDWKSGRICDLPNTTVDKNKPTTVARFDKAVWELQQQIDAQKKEAKMPGIIWPTFSATGNGRIDKKGNIDWHPFISNKPRIGKPLQYDINDLMVLQQGFAAMDCRFPLAIETVAQAIRKDKKQITPQDVENFRAERYNKAISKLYWLLNDFNSPHKQVIERNFKMKHLQIDDPLYDELARENVYMRVSSALGGPEPMNPGVSYVKGLRTEDGTIKQENRDDHPSEIRGVATNEMPEYLLASMVCGPTPNLSMITKDVPVAGGWDAEFKPPRLVPDLGYDLCAQGAAAKQVLVDSAHWSPIGVHVPPTDPHMSIWNVRGKKYQGLLEVVKAFADPKIIGDQSGSAYSKWWLDNIDKPAESVFRSFRMRYVHDVIEKRYFPALANPTYSSDKNWLATPSKGLPKGLNNAMKDSLKRYLDFVETMVVSGAKPEEVTRFKALRADVERHFLIGLNLIGPLRQLKPAVQAYAAAPVLEFKGEWDDSEQSEITANPKKDIQTWSAGLKSPMDANAIETYLLNNIDLKHAIENLKMFATERAASQGSAKQTLGPMIEAITENLKMLVTDLDAYHGFLVSIRIDVAG